jgi:hypothetical protein
MPQAQLQLFAGLIRHPLSAGVTYGMERKAAETATKWAFLRLPSRVSDPPEWPAGNHSGSPPRRLAVSNLLGHVMRSAVSPGSASHRCSRLWFMKRAHSACQAKSIDRPSRRGSREMMLDDVCWPPARVGAARKVQQGHG